MYFACIKSHLCLTGIGADPRPNLAERIVGHLVLPLRCQQHIAGLERAVQHTL